MSEKLFRQFQSALLGFTGRHGLEFKRWNERVFYLQPVAGGKSAALQIGFEPGFWELYGRVDTHDLPSLHRNLMRQIDGYNPALHSQFTQAFYLKTEAVRRWRADHSPGFKMPVHRVGAQLSAAVLPVRHIE